LLSCIGICKLDEAGVCIGCFRKMEEIAGWMRMTELQKKRQNVAALAERRLAATTMPGRIE